MALLTRMYRHAKVLPGRASTAAGPGAGALKAVKPRLVVVGNGMAGHKLCERLVALGATRRWQILVLGEEPRPAYDRVHLTRILQGSTPEQITLSPLSWYRDHGIDLVTGDPAVALDREAREVVTRSGRRVRYDRLVLATGSRAHRPDIPGARLAGVFVYRTIDDLQAMMARAATCRRVAILGGGLLGLEAGAALRELGLDTWIIERGTGLLTRQLDPHGSQVIEAHVRKLGLHVCTTRQTEAIEENEQALLLQFNTGECLRVDMVVFAVGIRPRDELAAASGLKLGPHGGIEVDDRLATSDPNIFAVGECASHRGTTYGLAAPACRMADALALSLAGRRAAFTGADASTWLKLPGIQVATLGEFQAGTDDLVAPVEDGYRRLVLENGRVVGAVGIGAWPEQARVQELIDRRARLWSWQENRFRRTGMLWRSKGTLPVHEWPASAIVCNCLGVRRGELSRHCQAGCVNVGQLAAASGASTICGSCQPLLVELLGGPVTRRSLPGSRWLMGASLASLVVAVMIGWLSPIPFATTVQGGWHLDILWREGFWKQASGFTLLGLAVLSLVLSLRKRWKRFQRGSVGAWRAVHATLGLLTLLVLIAHTGFRMGHNLNFVLMTDFLALAVLGSAAGGINAAEARFGGPLARRLRAVWTGAHVALVWPLPVLVLAHVLAAYLW